MGSEVDHIQGLRILRDMVHPSHQWKVDKLIQQEETNMGLVPDTLDDDFENVEASKGGGGLLPAGDYEGVVLAAEVNDGGTKSWVQAQLSIKLQVTDGPHEGSVTFFDMELAPLEGKDGQPSKGKLGFVKGQLEALGYTGKLSEVEYAVESFLGAKLKFRQKVDNHIDPVTGEVDAYGKINPKTNLPFIDREVYLNELLAPGFAQTPSAATESPSEPAVY